MLGHEDLRKASVLIYANKQDIKGCMSVAQISKELNLTSIKKHKWQIQPCCAISGEGYVFENHTNKTVIIHFFTFFSTDYIKDLNGLLNN